MPTLSKKIPDQVSALVREDTANDVGVVIETLIFTEVVKRSGGSPLGVVGAENHTGHAGVNDRSHAHDAGFDANIEGGV